MILLQHPIGPRHILRDNEQRNTFGACRRTFNPCQRQVHEILAGLMLAAGDEDLLPPDLVMIAHGPGAGGDVGKRTARLGFREGHGALPFSFHHRRHEDLAVRLRRKQVDQFHSAGGQAQIALRAAVGRFEDHVRRRENAVGHLHAAVLQAHQRGEPACIGHGPEDPLQLRMTPDPSVLPDHGLLVHLLEKREEFPVGNILRALQQQLHLLPAAQVREFRVFQQAVDLMHIVQKEVQVPETEVLHISENLRSV